MAPVLCLVPVAGASLSRYALSSAGTEFVLGLTLDGVNCQDAGSCGRGAKVTRS